MKRHPLSTEISSDILKEFAFIKRPDFIFGNVEDCWSYRNLILYKVGIGWHVQVGYMVTPAILSTPIMNLRDLLIVFKQANGIELSLD